MRKINSITIPKNVTGHKEHVSGYCNSLTSLTIPDGKKQSEYCIYNNIPVKSSLIIYLE